MGHMRLSWLKGTPIRAEKGPGLSPAARAARYLRVTLAAAVALSIIAGSGRVAHALSADVERALETSKYVYIASNRKDGSFGTPAEIWFMVRDGAVWVASDKTSWRARRIRWGRPKARIAVGSRNGPTFMATGSFVSDEKLYEAMFKAYALKYKDEWPKWEPRFRNGLTDHSRVLIKYVPIE